MTYAIIETGGKQIRVEPGRFYDIERLAVGENEKVTIDKVLFVENDGTFSVGQPLVAGATVEGTVLRHLRGRKIIVYKMKPKKKTRKKQGHRQELTRLMIDAITLGGTSIHAEQAAAIAASVAEAPTVEAPVEETPAVETPAVEVPVVEAPAEESPAVEAAVEVVPAEDIPVEEAPAEDNE